MSFTPDLSDKLVQAGIPPGIAQDLENMLLQLSPTDSATSMTAAQLAGTKALVSGGGTSVFAGVTYDGSNRCTGYVSGSITYTITYGTGTITVTGSDASSKLITLDGSARVVSIA